MLILIFSLLVIHLVSINIGPRFIIQVNKGVYSLFVQPDPRTAEKPEMYLLAAETLTIQTEDNLRIKGFLIKSQAEKVKGTIVLVHGIRAGKEHFFKVCKLLSDNGYNSVIFDLRAHGESQGDYCTYGFHEKKDITILLNQLSSRNDISHNFGIWGQSLGGAISLQVMARDQRIKFGIVESAFSEMRKIVHDYFRMNAGFDIPVITNYMLTRAESIASFDAEQVWPARSARLITRPVMLVHGSKDDRIKPEYAQENFAALSSTCKYFVEIENAGHLDVWEKGGERYFSDVIRFMDKYINS